MSSTDDSIKDDELFGSGVYTDNDNTPAHSGIIPPDRSSLDSVFPSLGSPLEEPPPLRHSNALEMDCSCAQNQKSADTVLKARGRNLSQPIVSSVPNDCFTQVTSPWQPEGGRNSRHQTAEHWLPTTPSYGTYGKSSTNQDVNKLKSRGTEQRSVKDRTTKERTINYEDHGNYNRQFGVNRRHAQPEYDSMLAGPMLQQKQYSIQRNFHLEDCMQPDTVWNDSDTFCEGKEEETVPKCCDNNGQILLNDLTVATEDDSTVVGGRLLHSPSPTRECLSRNVTFQNRVSNSHSNCNDQTVKPYKTKTDTKPERKINNLHMKSGKTCDESGPPLQPHEIPSLQPTHDASWFGDIGEGFNKVSNNRKYVDLSKTVYDHDTRSDREPDKDLLAARQMQRMCLEEAPETVETGLDRKRTQLANQRKCKKTNKNKKAKQKQKTVIQSGVTEPINISRPVFTSAGQINDTEPHQFTENRPDNGELTNDTEPHQFTENRPDNGELTNDTEPHQFTENCQDNGELGNRYSLSSTGVDFPTAELFMTGPRSELEQQEIPGRETINSKSSCVRNPSIQPCTFLTVHNDLGSDDTTQTKNRFSDKIPTLDISHDTRQFRDLSPSDLTRMQDLSPSDLTGMQDLSHSDTTCMQDLSPNDTTRMRDLSASESTRMPVLSSNDIMRMSGRSGLPIQQETQSMQPSVQHNFVRSLSQCQADEELAIQLQQTLNVDFVGEDEALARMLQDTENRRSHGRRRRHYEHEEQEEHSLSPEPHHLSSPFESRRENWTRSRPGLVNVSDSRRRDFHRRDDHRQYDHRRDDHIRDDHRQDDHRQDDHRRDVNVWHGENREHDPSVRHRDDSWHGNNSGRVPLYQRYWHTEDNEDELYDRDEDVGFDILPDRYRNEFDHDVMTTAADREHSDHMVSMMRDPRMLSSFLVNRAPGMMVPADLDLDDYEALWELAEQLGEVRRVGLEESELSLLPQHPYQSQPGDEKTKEPDCIICLTNFVSGDMIRPLSCLHQFHVECINSWLVRNAKCPICREEVRTEQQ